MFGAPGKEDYRQQEHSNWGLAGRLMRSIDLDNYGMMLILFNTSLFKAHLKNLRTRPKWKCFCMIKRGCVVFVE